MRNIIGSPGDHFLFHKDQATNREVMIQESVVKQGLGINHGRSVAHGIPSLYDIISKGVQNL